MVGERERAGGGEDGVDLRGGELAHGRRPRLGLALSQTHLTWILHNTPGPRCGGGLCFLSGGTTQLL